MAAPPDLAGNPGNDVLALLDRATREALAGDLEYVPLLLRDELLHEARPIRHVHFPTSGVISMLAAAAASGKKIEVGTVGREGFSGLALFFGATHAPGTGFVQVEGACWRMPARAFIAATRAHPQLVTALHRFAQSYLVQVSQTTACNRVHSPLQRCARWLLMTGDRVDGDEFNMTQEFLGHMLGERRPTVSHVASQLQQRGLIAYRRGRVTIVDRARLAETACECYGVIRRHQEAMVPPRS